MFGFILGTACLIGFISVWRHGPRHRFGRSGPWWLLRKLDTSPAQERVIRNAVNSIKEEARGFARGGKSSRRELAQLLRAPDYDKDRVRDWFTARERELGQVTETALGALAEVHEVLDDQQRDKLAALVERGPRFGRGFRSHGPYRDSASETP